MVHEETCGRKLGGTYASLYTSFRPPFGGQVGLRRSGTHAERGLGVMVRMRFECGLVS